MKNKNKVLNIPFFIIGLSLLLTTSCKEPNKGNKYEVLKKTPTKDSIKLMSLMGKRGIITHSYMNSITPFENSYLKLPNDYSGPSYSLKHDYPTNPPESSQYPWKAVTNNGLITQANSMAYVEALKAYVTKDMRNILYNYDTWNSQAEPWWQSIWLGSQREPIHGMYVGSGFPAGTLTKDQDSLTTFVYTLYNATAAVTLNKIWGTDLNGAENPNLNNASDAQYEEGSVIIKFAFVTATGNDWSPMENAAIWTVYTDVDPATGEKSGKAPQMMDLALMQFDIIVKDSEAAPKTGWVFSTLVYDKNASGKDAWDNMVPLGATWGDNPEIIDLSDGAINAPVTVNTGLTENWINMNTPEYSRSTLGWDGRLSGPNDGAVVSPAVTQSGKKYANLATVGCFGCHSSAQYKFNSFLLPGYVNDSLIMYDPGSEEWMKWFQDKDGKTPMDQGEGQIGLDYDMVTAFKSIPMWQEAMKDRTVE